MAGSVEPRSSCSPGEVTQLRAEARRELNALLVFSGVAGLLFVAIEIWGGTGALWPIGTALVVALALGVWATYIRGWQTLRAHRRRAATSTDMPAGVGVQPDNI